MFARALSILTLTFTLAGCSSLEFPWVYRISVQQGNIIDQEDIDKLELGMSKRQVQFVLGSPMLIDTFNQDRWDYFYSRRSGNNETTQKQFTVFFDKDVYVRHEGNIEPTPADKQSDDEGASSDKKKQLEDLEQSVY